MIKTKLSVAVAIFICVRGRSALAADGDDRTRPSYSLDVALLTGVEPVHDNLPGEAAFFYGGDVRLRLVFVSLGVRVEKTACYSSDGFDGFTRVLGTLGFNIGVGDRTALCPYLGFGSMHIAGSSHAGHPDEPNARIGLELEHFLTRHVSIGGGIAFDAHAYTSDGIYASLAVSGLFRLGFHLPFG